MNEIHELPLAGRLVDDLIREWLDRAYATTIAAEQGVEQMRYLHLDNYSYALTPKILDALRRATVNWEEAGGECL